jgi:hypothetical protein
MSQVVFGIPPNFELVCGVASASFIVHHIYMPMKIMKARQQCVQTSLFLGPVSRRLHHNCRQLQQPVTRALRRAGAIRPIPTQSLLSMQCLAALSASTATNGIGPSIHTKSPL